MYYKMLLCLTLNLSLFYLCGSVASFKSSSSSPFSPSGRDGYVLNMFEVVLSTMESKMRRVENLDRAVQHLMRKMDTIEQKMDTQSTNIINKIDNLGQNLNSKISIMSNSESSISNINSRLDTMASKLDVISNMSKNSNPSKRHITNFEAAKSRQNDEEELFIAQPSNRKSKVFSGAASTFAPNFNKIERKGRKFRRMYKVSDAMDDVKEMVNGIDRRLGFHINIVSENLGKMTNLVEEVHEAIMDNEDDGNTEHVEEEKDKYFSSPSSIVIQRQRYPKETTVSNGRRSYLNALLKTTKPTLASSHKHKETKNAQPSKKSKFDMLLHTVQPLLEVKQKVEDIRGMLAGTKTSVDHLMPKSEELLSQSQRQERAISNIHNDLTEKTNAIINELSQVERELTSSKDQLSKKQNQLKESRNEKIRVVKGKSRTVSTRDDLGPTISTTAALLRESTDQKDTIEGFPTSEALLATQATFSQEELSYNRRGPIALVENGTLDYESGIDPSIGNGIFAEDQYLGSFENSEEDSPISSGSSSSSGSSTKGPNVIFPSIENKPIVVNTTFTYNLGRNADKIIGYSCADLYNKGLRQNGIYYLQLSGTRFWYLKVFCDMKTDGGGWTVIQRRDDYGDPRENFNRDWDDYKYGFGKPDQELWLGNENIFLLTKASEYEMRVDLEDFDGNKRYAQYSEFKLGSEKEKYRLEIGGYEGNAGDSLNDPWYGSNLRPFSTFDNDNDRSSLNCASMLKGGWWWKSCGRGLNGLYMDDPNDLTARQGIVWFRWKGWDYTLKRAKMMIRPKSFIAKFG